MADMKLRSLNFGGGNIYFPLPLVTAEDNDKILAVVNGEWTASDVPAGKYIWSKKGMSESVTTDNTGGTYSLTTSNDSRPSNEIEYSSNAPVYNVSTGKWEFTNSTIVTLTNKDTVVPTFSGNKYVRLTSEPNIWYLATGINTGGSGPYSKILAYSTKYTADIDSVNVKYVVSDNHTIYPDSGWQNGYYYERVTVGSLTSLISFTIAGTEYQAEPGMKWGEWLTSEYNTDGFTNGESIGEPDMIFDSNVTAAVSTDGNTAFCYTYEEIIEGTAYLFAY